MGRPADAGVVGGHPAMTQPTAIRPACVAGSFYPDDPQRPLVELDALLAAPASSEDASGALAIVSQHAGYRYSPSPPAPSGSWYHGAQRRGESSFSGRHISPGYTAWRYPAGTPSRHRSVRSGSTNLPAR
jgi:hypothetical protein